MKNFRVATITAVILLLSGCGTWLGNPSDAPGSSSGDAGPPKERQEPIASKQPERNESNKVDEAPTVINIDFDNPVGGITTDQVAFALDINIPSGEVAGNLSLSSAKAVISSVTLTSSQNNKTVTFDGPFIIDLIKNTVTPKPEPIELEPGLYEKVTFKTHALDASENLTAEDNLVGNAFEFDGQLTIGENNSPFAVTLPMEIGFEISKEVFPEFPGILVEKGQENEVNIDLQFPLWFANAKIDVSTPQALLRTVTSTLETVSKLLVVTAKED